MARCGSRRVTVMMLAAALVVAPAAFTDQSAPAGPTKINAKCVKVVDGDTLVIDCGKSERTVDLAGIDAPELKQRFGTKVRHFLRQTVKGQELEVELVDVDGEVQVAKVTVNGADLSARLVELGLAWPAEGTAADDPLQQLAEKARSYPCGLWTDDNPQPPWEYRMAM